MGYRLARMSYSSIIRESEDFGCAICDHEGRQLCESTQSTPLQSGPIAGLPGRHRRGASPSWATSGARATWSCTTTPTTARPISPTSRFVVPVFLGGRAGRLLGDDGAPPRPRRAHARARCGIVDADDAFAEGLLLNAVKVEEEGRRGRQRLADHRRQHAHPAPRGRRPGGPGGRRQARRRALRSSSCGEYGLEAVRAASEHLMDHSERMLRQRDRGAARRHATRPRGRSTASSTTRPGLPGPARSRSPSRSAASRPARRPRRHRAAGRPADQHAVRRHRRHGGPT